MDDLQHPLLGDEPTLRLLPDRHQIKGEGLGGCGLGLALVGAP